MIEASVKKGFIRMFKGALPLNRRAALSAFLCASTACASYIIVFYQSRGLSSAQISSIQVINGAIGLICPALWALIADVIGSTRKVLLINLLITAGLRILSPLMPAGLAIALMLISNAAACATLSLSDAIFIGRDDYAGIRSWGVIAQAIGILIMGVVYDKLSADMVFYLCSLFSAATLWALWGVADPPRPAREKCRLPLTSLLNVKYVLLVLGGIILGIPVMASSDFAVYVFDGAGLGREALGAMLSLRIVVQTVGLALGQAMTRRKIPSGVQLALACSLIAVECCCYPLVTASWQMLALGTLFGFTYGLIMGAEVRCASMYSPAEMQSTAQALGCPLMLGVGGMISGALGSSLLNTLSAAVFIRMTALFTIPAAFIFLLMARFTHKNKSKCAHNARTS